MHQSGPGRESKANIEKYETEIAKLNNIREFVTIPCRL